jgi:succinate-semialdehyde dehydrogenase/glutarate-semialdehyde dehydrogenase
MGESMMTIEAINPATGEVLKTYYEMEPATVKEIIGRTHEAFLSWRRTTFSYRASLMRKAAEVLRVNADEYARLMAQEMGKPVHDGIAEAQKCAWGCDLSLTKGPPRIVNSKPARVGTRAVVERAPDCNPI